MTAKSDYRVVVERNRLKFAAAHMATYSGQLEPLHGHNYALHVEVSGSLDSNSWVIDFSTLKRLAREICDRLDHRFLLQGDSEMLQITNDANTCTITSGSKSYRFPLEDVAELPIDNTTAERLAEWIGGRLAEELARKGATNLTGLRVGVEEAPGQAGWHTRSL
jgi:6-pyruvoyltetrahydropterin/6-carboxytetrahydropterin synthase